MTELENRPEFDRLPSRVQVLWRIAASYHLIVDPLNGPSGVRGDGDSLGGLDPKLYTPSVREFERLCQRMRVDRNTPLQVANGEKVSVRALYWNLAEWHLRCERSLVVPALKLTKSRKGRLERPLTDELGAALPIVRVRRDRGASEVKALAGIVWMAGAWGLVSEPMLPAAFLEPIRVAA